MKNFGGGVFILAVLGAAAEEPDGETVAVVFVCFGEFIEEFIGAMRLQVVVILEIDVVVHFKDKLLSGLILRRIGRSGRRSELAADEGQSQQGCSKK